MITTQKLNDDLTLHIGTTGDDSIIGGTGNDIIIGVVGKNTIDGGEGDDIIFSGLGNDFVIGGLGNDIIYGQDGNDSLFGGVGDDIIFGGRGNDTISAGQGSDSLFGGSGRDSFVFTSITLNETPEFDIGHNVVRDFAVGTDLLIISSESGTTAAEILSNVQYSQSGAVIDFGNGGVIELVGVADGSLTESDIAFV